MLVMLILAVFVAFALMVLLAVYMEKLAAFFDAINWPFVCMVALAFAGAGWYLSH